MQTAMIGRPRPVTATVTKPRWMQIPDPDVLAQIRKQSLGSTGSTESLTSVLDHDSYTSDTEDLDMKGDKDKSKQATENESDIWPDSKAQENQEPIHSITKSSQSSLSAWEQWVICKAKEEQNKKQKILLEKRKVKEEKEMAEKEKQMKTEVNRQTWLEKKDKEEKLAKKIEKVKINEVKRAKEEGEEQIRTKSEKVYSAWIDKKKEEDKERKKIAKEMMRREKEGRQTKKQKADEIYKQWLKQAKNRPKSAPNSYGYIAGKVIGYHDRTATPQPSYYNPMPWQPVSMPPSSSKTERQGKGKHKSRPYSLKSEKYY